MENLEKYRIFVAKLGVLWILQKSECCHQVSDDDYGDYFYGIYAVADDYYFIGFTPIF